MPYATGSVVRCLVNSVAGCSPFPACFVAHQNETGSTRTRHLPDSGRNILTPAAQRIDETSYRLGQFGCFDGFVPVMLRPGLEQLGDILATPELKTRRALNLDGGSSSAFWFNGERGVFSIAEQKTVRDFVIVTPK